MARKKPRLVKRPLVEYWEKVTRDGVENAVLRRVPVDKAIALEAAFQKQKTGETLLSDFVKRVGGEVVE